MKLPVKDTLSQADLIKWGKELISYFVVPVLLVFLTSLQSGNLQLALGAAYGTALACAISLLSKYKAGIDPKDLASLQKTEFPVTVEKEQVTNVNVPNEEPTK